MRIAKLILTMVALLGLNAACRSAEPHATATPEIPIQQLDEQVNRLLPQMTTEEKLLQLLSYKPNGVPRLGIPNLEAGEVLHGVVSSGCTSFPQSIALGATWDPDLVERMANVIAQEARAVGIGQGFAPMLGLARDPRWGRVEESYGEDPLLVSRIAVAYINGLQGKGPNRFGPEHIIATPKHFVADGEPWAGANGEDFEISERVLREVFMPPFEAAVKEAHTGSIMPAHHALNGVPCHMNSWLLDTVLRQEWGFDGFVTSDMGDIPKLAGGHKMAHDETESAVFALSAGVDMELVGRLYMGNLLKALKAGKIPISVIDEAARRVLRVKIQLLGIGTTTNAPSEAPNEKTKQEILNYKGDDDIWAKLIADGKFNTPASGRRPDWQKILNDPSHDALALETAQKAIVLLKNANSLLPLDKTKLKKIAVVGPLATQRNLGGYSTGNPKFYLNILDGLKTYLGSSVEVGYAPGCQLKDAAGDLLAPAVALAQSADVVIAVVGHSRAQLGENLDRDDLGLIGGQLKLVQAVAATGKPVVVVFQNGAPITEPWICDHIPVIVESWYLGQATGTALAQMLFGDVNPGGKMPVSVACSIGQIPCYYNHAAFHGPINYYGAKSGNLFCFGHGLSYTSFKYNGLKIEPIAIAPNQVATVTVAVSNTGARAGDEVVQLYCHQSYTSLKRPVKELKGFQRVTLAPGESKTVSFAMGFEQLKFWKDGKWITEAGDVDLMVGSSSDDIRQKGKLVLAATK